MSSSQMNSQTTFLALMYTINFLENSSNIKPNTTFNTNTFYYDNSDNEKIHTKNNIYKNTSVNAIHRSKHNIGQPQWRGYAH